MGKNRPPPLPNSTGYAKIEGIAPFLTGGTDNLVTANTSDCHEDATKNVLFREHYDLELNNMVNYVKTVGVMRYLLCLSLLCCALLASCRSLDSESGLYDVKLEHTYKVPVDGMWFWGKGNPFPGKTDGAIYVAPMDVSLVEKDEPERAHLLRPQMYEYIVTDLHDALAEANRANNMSWKLTADPAGADLRIDIALVHFKPQRPGLRLLSSIGGHFIKVPGVSDVVGHFAAGDVRIEVAIRNNRNGQLLMAAKDSNRKKVRLYSADAYSRTGNADVNLRAWARKIANLVREGFPDKSRKTIKERIGDRNLWDVTKAHLDIND